MVQRGKQHKEVKSQSGGSKKVVDKSSDIVNILAMSEAKDFFNFSLYSVSAKYISGIKTLIDVFDLFSALVSIIYPH